MAGIDGLVPALRKQVLALEDDLRARVDGPDLEARHPGVERKWRAEYDEAFNRAKRTAASWEEWRDELISQSAVAWVLLTVFARYVEDKGLVSPRWISGSSEDERRNALDARRAFFAEHTTPDYIPTDREWLQQIIDHFSTYDATRALVDQYSPLHRVAPSGDAARRLLEFWWEADGSGEPRWSFTAVDTRFLGDVYQDLSEYAKKTYALLQTPEFVEEFILDQTLTPALAERSLDGFTVIDPTCGSGHFLLGAFRRLLREWQRHAPALPIRALVGKALASVHGVDINPAAVAIARFRLLVAALDASGDKRIEHAVDFELSLATGDSLLWGARQQALTDDILMVGQEKFAYSTENVSELKKILQQEYDVVVGNPPYVSVKDPAIRELYRQQYPRTCYGKYVLTVPFMELFFELAKPTSNNRAGWIGKITSNSFMKRRFGVHLIENFLSSRDLRKVIDSEGAWIPGHNSDGTPTVIIVATGREIPSPSIRAVLTKGVREDSSVGESGQGHIWQSIAININNPHFENDVISVTDLPKQKLSRHPWSLSGGGAPELMEFLESNNRARLERLVDSVGITSFTLEDDVFIQEYALMRRIGVNEEHLRMMVEGKELRNWESLPHGFAIWPYSKSFEALKAEDLSASVAKFMWPFKSTLANNKMFDGRSKTAAGLNWYEYGRLTASKFQTPMAIAFPEIASHNHFILDQGGKVFKQTAPIIKLKSGADYDIHLNVLGALNSSLACFWIKEKFKPKGGAAAHSWLRTYQINSTALREFPLPSGHPTLKLKAMQHLADELSSKSPELSVAEQIPTQVLIQASRDDYQRIRRMMISHQEELDWEYYQAYGIIDDDLTYRGKLPEIDLGERSFEILIARNSNGVHPWFDEHRIDPALDVPDHLPDDYKEVVHKRLKAIGENRYLQLLEKPEYKRRWDTEAWDKRLTEALRNWLLDRVEKQEIWFDRDGRPTPKSLAQLADELDRDADFRRVIRIWAQSVDVSTGAALKRLLTGEGVPFLAAYRYKPSGLEKRKVWEYTWDLQRREDQGQKLDVPIPAQPKYKPVDFNKPTYWPRRGKLDVPKERFISYPDANRLSDTTELLGWAGWTHAEQALALAGLIQERVFDGADAKTLVPLVAGLVELYPWVKQWHNEIDLDYGTSMAEIIEEQIRSRCAELGITPEDAAAWRPQPTSRGRRKTSKKTDTDTAQEADE